LATSTTCCKTSQPTVIDSTSKFFHKVEECDIATAATLMGDHKPNACPEVVKSKEALSLANSINALVQKTTRITAIQVCKCLDIHSRLAIRIYIMLFQLDYSARSMRAGPIRGIKISVQELMEWVK
jgi:hypothetical protein